jgi:hypothetical protein
LNPLSHFKSRAYKIVSILLNVSFYCDGKLEKSVFTGKYLPYLLIKSLTGSLYLTLSFVIYYYDVFYKASWLLAVAPPAY